jgi:hypothetical protein
MDPAYISALSALAGSLIGGLTSLAGSWVSQNAQARTQQVLGDWTRRQELYKAFIEEASKLYGDALVSNNAEISKFIPLSVILNRMRVQSSASVVQEAEAVIEKLAETYLEPNQTLRELRGHHDKIDILRQFSDACRQDLNRLSHL